MSTVERLLKATEDIWAGYHEHPFVQGIKNGTLDQEKFRSYIIQDYWYLMDYTKVFAVGVAKSKSVETMKMFAKYIQAILDGEVNVHNGYMGVFGITQEELDRTPIAQDNRSYTSYMLSVAYKGGEAEVLTAIFSCAYSYEVIARRMVEENPAAVDANKQGKIMMIVMLIFTIFMGFMLPAAMGIYWLIGGLISMLQTFISQMVMNHANKKKRKI